MPLMEIENDVSSTPAASGRRKSGRAVKAPEKFIPDYPSTATRPANSKRKRTDDDEEGDASEEAGSEPEEDDESDDEEVESAGEEELREARRKARSSKKPIAKKPKTNGTASHARAPAVRLPNRPKKAKKVTIADDTAEGLYADVFTSGQESGEAVAGFLNRYKENGPGAVAELVNFVLKSAGCDLKVTEDDINDTDNINGRIADLQEEYQALLQQNISDYPLISRAKNSHAFRTSFLDFFDTLNKTLDATGVLYDEDDLLMENVFHWMASMSSSTLRPFRHTATAVALTIATSTCNIAKERIDKAAKTLRQFESEKKNKKPNKARLADFEKKVQHGEGEKEILENRLKDIFDTIWVHRYHDVDPKIRTECIEAMGQWIHTLPGYWFEGSYLRYFGWMLTDAAPPMRLEVVKQIERIMKYPENAGRMGSFIERFRPRIIEMATRDSDAAVRSHAVDLVDLLRKAAMLEPDDIDIIGKLIFDTEPRVRRAVVGFFVENVKDVFDGEIEELGGEDALEELLAVENDDFESPRASWIKFKCLANVLQNYDAPDQDDQPSQIDQNNPESVLDLSLGESRFTLAAQALYDKMPELREWRVLAGYLLFDHSTNPKSKQANRALKQAFKPEETEEVILLEILQAVVKIGLNQITDADKMKDRSKKRNARVESAEAKENTARHLADIIPRLLKKFGADPKTAKAVLRLEHSLNLGVFQELRQDSTGYAKLLDEISAQFRNHEDKGVLSEASVALLHAREYEELEEVTENKLQTLWEDNIKILRNINKAGEISVRGAFTNSILAELSNNLVKIEKLSGISNNVEVMEAHSGKESLAPINILLNVVARGQLVESDPDIDALEDKVVLSASRAAMFYFMWKVHSLTTSISSGQVIADSDTDQLKERQEIFITNLVGALSSRATIDPVRLLATGTLLDLHVLFATLTSRATVNSQASDENENIRTLFKHIKPDVQTELTAIFDHTEKHYAKKAKKRLEEPDEDEAPVDDLESDDEDEDATENERQSETLKAEQQLCELTGKLILAILAKVIDAEGPLKGKLQRRIERNRIRLGHNFKEVVAYLDDSKDKAKKNTKSKAQLAAEKKESIRKELEEEDEQEENDEEDDPFAAAEPEGEGEVDMAEEDQEAQEAAEDEDEEIAEADDAGAAEDEDEDEDMLGD
ncbi:stag domain-containing protein [Rutstroemia sp. NJR-2017a BBW]|nr:stag domain-containing protein [Rutstroemia sp. NJR-2017a BBW]